MTHRLRIGAGGHFSSGAKTSHISLSFFHPNSAYVQLFKGQFPQPPWLPSSLIKDNLVSIFYMASKDTAYLHVNMCFNTNNS